MQNLSAWDSAYSLLGHYMRQNLLNDFYRRQNDIIDSLIEVRGFVTPASPLQPWLVCY